MPRTVDVEVRVVYRRWWLRGVAKAVMRWRALFNALLSVMPVEAYVGRHLLAQWRVQMASDGRLETTEKTFS